MYHDKSAERRFATKLNARFLTGCQHFKVIRALGWQMGSITEFALCTADVPWSWKKKSQFIWYDCEIPIFIYEMTRLHIMEFCLKLRLSQAEL